MSYLAYNPFLLNLVPIFNVADPTNGAGGDQVATSLNQIFTMLDTTNHTVRASVITPYPANGNGNGTTINMLGNVNITGSLTVGGVQVGPDANGSNYTYGTNYTVNLSNTGLILSNTTDSNSQAVEFIVSSNPVLQIDGLGRVLYEGDGQSSNINRFWISSAIHHADRMAVNLGGSNTMSTIFDVCNGDSYFNGNINCTSNINCLNLYQYSDMRIKRDIQPIGGALSTLCELKGVHYTVQGEPQIGFIAQEVYKVLPHAVNTTNPDKWAVDYTRVIPLLVEAIKELALKA